MNIDLRQVDLMEFWARYTRPTRKDAEALVGDRRKGYIGISATLASYACNLHVAYNCQVKSHDRHGVDVYLHSVDRCWEDLPQDMRDRVIPPTWVEALRNDTLTP